jgi:hypothetical protein
MTGGLVRFQRASCIETSLARDCPLLALSGHA